MLEIAEKVQLLTSAGLVVLIWMVQILIYPFFSYFESEHFEQTMTFHQRQITFIVMPLMLLEMVATVCLAVFDTNMMNIIILVLIVSIWASTFFIHVPIHHELSSRGKNLVIIQKLVKTNWVRTLFWSAKFIIFLIYTA